MRDGHRRREVFSTLLAGVVAGIVGFVLFGVAHALTIEPIWTRMIHGLPFAIAAGLALAFTIREIGADRPTYASAIGAGALAWAIVLPSTTFAAWLRVSGMRDPVGSAEVPLELAIALFSGAIAGALVSRRRRTIVIFAIVGIVLVTAMAGPVPVTNSRRAAMLFLSFLPMFVTGSLCAAFVMKRRANESLRGGLSSPAP